MLQLDDKQHGVYTHHILWDWHQCQFSPSVTCLAILALGWDPCSPSSKRWAINSEAGESVNESSQVQWLPRCYLNSLHGRWWWSQEARAGRVWWDESLICWDGLLLALEHNEHKLWMRIPSQIFQQEMKTEIATVENSGPKISVANMN